MRIISQDGNFNPRSREGSDYVGGGKLFTINDFNPRSREGSDEKAEANCNPADISIRAPARGATLPRGGFPFT